MFYYFCFRVKDKVLFLFYHRIKVVLKRIFDNFWILKNCCKNYEKSVLIVLNCIFISINLNININ